METSRRRALVGLALTALTAAGLWFSARRSSAPPEADPDADAEPGRDARVRGGEEQPSKAQPPRGEPPMPEPQAGAEPAPEAQPAPGQPGAEDYPSPYAGQSPAEEKRLLELTIQHNEDMLANAQQRLHELEQRADESDEADDELEWQRDAIRQGRAQTEAFKRRVQELAQKLR